MQKKLFNGLVLMFCLTCVGFGSTSFIRNHVTLDPVSNETAPVAMDSSIYTLYDSLNLQKLGLTKKAYLYAIQGCAKLKNRGEVKNGDIISIIDFSLPSSTKRLFIIDLKKGEMLFHTYVAHGRNSGKAMASDFSNQPESFKSSLGFYVTSETYSGKHGYALRLKGEEKGINDNAFNRGIVMHSAEYVSESTIKSLGFLGRSQGCPAVPAQLHEAIIKKIKNGTCLFMYSPVKYYSQASNFLKEMPLADDSTSA